MKQLGLLAYKDSLLNTHRGNSGGVFSNAKPLLLIAIIDAIDAGIITENKIYFDNKELEHIYQKLFISCDMNYDGPISSNLKVTPYQMPFFHLNKEVYYHIMWKEKVTPPAQAKSPSRRYLRENVQYAYLDENLWKLLMVPDNRVIFRKSLVNKFINLNI